MFIVGDDLLQRTSSCTPPHANTKLTLRLQVHLHTCEGFRQRNGHWIPRQNVRMNEQCESWIISRVHFLSLSFQECISSACAISVLRQQCGVPPCASCIAHSDPALRRPALQRPTCGQQLLNCKFVSRSSHHCNGSRSLPPPGQPLCRGSSQKVASAWQAFQATFTANADHIYGHLQPGCLLASASMPAAPPLLVIMLL